MSTQINVTVDSGGLSDKARQLQTAARQAQLEKERTINLSAEALDKRVAAQAAKGLSPDGLPLYGPSFKQPQIERRPAANRRGIEAGMSVAWKFRRLKEPPTRFNSAAYNSYPCSPGQIVPGELTDVTTKRLFINKIFSGDGSSFYEHEDGYDISEYWTTFGGGLTPVIRPGGQANFASAVAYKRNFGSANGELIPINEGATRRITRHEYWFPVGKNLMLYYFYEKRQSAFLFVNVELFYDCAFGDPPRIVPHRAAQSTDPFETIQINEHCVLVGLNFVKPINPPASVSEYLNDRVPSYKMIPAQATLNLSNSSFSSFNNEYLGVVPYNSFIWETTPAKIPLPAGISPWNLAATDNFSPTQPLPGGNQNVFNQFTGYFVATAGGYKSITRDFDIAHIDAEVKAPYATNINDATGFASGNTWEAIFDNATELKFDATYFNNRTVKVSSVPMSPLRQRPSDPLIYQDGSTQTSAIWSSQITLGFDWANTKYCRAQLFKLGFTSADLAPPPPPTP